MKSPDISPVGGTGTDTPLSRSPISEILRKTSGYFGSKEFRADGCVSPFDPILNSSELLSGSYSKLQTQIHLSGTTGSKSTPGTTFQGSGEESSVGFIKRSRESFRTRVRKRKVRREGNRSGSSSSSSSFSTSRVNMDIYELADKMEEVRESTVQAKQEISTLFQHLINKERTSESQEENLFQVEKRRKLEEMVSLETELIKLKMEGQVVELDKMKNENTNLSAKYYQLLKEKDESVEELRTLKENCSAVEQSLHRTRREKSELSCQIEDLKLEIRSLEKHMEHLEDKRKLQLEEIKDIKGYLNSERDSISEEKTILGQERDKYRRLLHELNSEKEELMAEKKNLNVELDKFRMEQEKFMLKFNSSRSSEHFSRRNEESFVMIDAYGELDSILTENRILRGNLDQMASEKTQLENEIKRLQNSLEAAENGKIRRDSKSLLSSSEKDDIIKEKERVISSLMDVLEDLKKENKSTKYIKEHERNLRELVHRISESATRFDAILASKSSAVKLAVIQDQRRRSSSVEEADVEETRRKIEAEEADESLDSQLLNLQRRIESLEQKKSNFFLNSLQFRKVKG